MKENDYSRVIFTTMKDEGPYILDWVSYHLAIGFTHFVIFTNDCSDGTDQICRHLERKGLVTQKNNPGPYKKGLQKDAYHKMQKTEAFEKAEWAMTLDVDEYLRIDIGDGTLDTLLKALPDDLDAVSFVWQLFGSNGIANISGKPVIEEFTRRGIRLQTQPYEALSFKTLFRKSSFERLGTHRPLNPNKERPIWVDADGVVTPKYYEQRLWKAYESSIGFGTILGRVNHYATRSLDAFMIKWSRGFVHPDAPTVRGKGTAQDYWRLFEWNDEEDTEILRFLNSSQKIKAELLKDERIERQAERALKWHKKRARHIRRNENPDLAPSLLLIDRTKPLPDFSQYGCPKHPEVPEVPLALLQRKLQKSVLNYGYLHQHYERFPPQSFRVIVNN